MNINKQASVYVLFFFACTFFFTGCKKDVYDQNKDDAQGNDFNYATRTEKSLDIDYGIKGYKAIFEIYTENPIVTENGVSKKKENVSAPFKVYTNDNCRYTGSINLPAATDKVYLYSENMGLPQCVELKVGEDGIQFNMEEYIKKSQSTDANAKSMAQFARNSSLSRAGEDNPYNIQAKLGDWSRNGGIPFYLLNTQESGYREPIAYWNTEFPEGLMDRINKALSSNDNSQFTKSSDVVNIKVKEEASINLIFLQGKGEYHNAIGYYYYETQNPPKDLDKLPKYIAFPHCYTDGYNDQLGALTAGNRIQLKYYGKEGTGVGTEKFPKDITIGWFLLANSFDRFKSELIYNPKEGIWYSNNEFNPKETKSCISIYDKESEITILGFEDSGDQDYKDALFYLEATPSEAIYDPDKPTTDPEVPHDPDKSGETVGTLAFEDLWPNKGDYDMNDVVVTYKRSYTFDKDNKILEIRNTFTPYHSGGKIQSAFGYQINIPQTVVDNVVMTNNNTTSANVDGKGMENNQEKASFILFDDIEQAKNNGDITLTIKLSVTAGITVNDLQKNDFYNPFICVSRGKAENPVTSYPRREIHLTHFAPTKLADIEHDFGQYDDRSNIDKKGLATGPDYYVGDKTNPYPFAIDLPITDYKVPDESVKINVFYPDFFNWVKDPMKYADWYKHPNK